VLADWGLNLLIFLPLLAAIVIWVWPWQHPRFAPRFSLAVGLVGLVLAALLYAQLPAAMRAHGPYGLVGDSSAQWIVAGPRPGPAESDVLLHNAIVLRYHVGLDALSMPLTALTALLVLLSIACSFNGIRTRTREYYAWLLALTTGMLGVFAARDVLLFYIFFEFTLVPLYFLIGIWGHTERRYAANKFFLYTFAGSVITFTGILYLGIRAAQIHQSSVLDFDLIRLSTLSLQQLSTAEQSLLFIAFFCGFAIKVPFFPLHTWLPLAHTQAPTAGSVLLAGILLKLGTYGFLRFSLPMVPHGALHWAQAMGVLAVAGIIWGFCMLGMFSLLPVGLSGSVLYMVNHGLSTGALFLVVGMIYERYHTRDMSQFSGLARQMPVLAFFFVLFVLSSIGLPGLNGFVSEFTVLLAAFNSDVLGRWYGAIGAAGILLGAIYMLYAAGRVLFGPVQEPPDTPDLSTGLKRDLTGREIAILAPIAVLVVVLGVAPRLITDTLDPAVQTQILDRVQEARGQTFAESSHQGRRPPSSVDDWRWAIAGLWPMADRGLPVGAHPQFAIRNPQSSINPQSSVANPQSRSSPVLVTSPSSPGGAP
jgi:NADH-quinone oxidoreductase subunit M